MIALALTAGTASPSDAFSGQSGTSAAPATPGPDLVAVRLDPANVYEQREAATFCFDEPLRAGYAPAAFTVMTYDAGRYLRGRSAAAAGPSCLRVTFDPVADLNRLGSVGAVDGAGVRGVDGRSNLPSSAPLEGSALKPVAGRTTAPDLIGAVPRAADATVALSFDQPIDRSEVDLDGIGLAAPDGTRAKAVDLVEVTDDAVRVRFPAGTPVSPADTFSVAPGAVRTLPFDGLSGGPPLSGFGPATLAALGPPGVIAGTGAHLTDAKVPAGGRMAIEYTADPGSVDPGGLLAVRDNGAVEAAESVARTTRPTTLTVAFPNDGAVARDPQGVVAFVSMGTTPPSAIAVGPGAPATPGRTDGPDLVSGAFDPITSQATFTYDEPISNAGIGAPDRFLLLAPDGTAVPGIAQGPAAGDRTVQIGYPGGTGAPAGFAAALGAASDQVGNRQPLGSVGASAATAAAKAAIVVPVTLTLRHRRGARLFTGRVHTKAPCRRRLVRLMHGARQIKSARSHPDGRYRVRFRRRPSGRVRARVTARTVVRGGVPYACTAARSVTRAS